MRDSKPVDHHDHEKILELTRVPSRTEAAVIVAQLKSQGIDATIAADDVGAMRAYLTFTSGVQVLVFEHDLATAQRILVDLGY